jgi:AraC family transcriptional regulator
MPSHIPLVEDDHVIGLDGKPLAPLPVNAWMGLPFEVHPHMRKAEVAHRTNPHPLLLVHLGSRGRARIRSGHTVFDLRLEPGQVDVFSAGFRMDHAWWDCTPGEVLAVAVDPERARNYLQDDGVFVDLSTRLSVRDSVLERLLSGVRSEVDAGCPSGALFAEGVSLALLARLRACYGRRTTAQRPVRKLSPIQSRDTVEFIDANLGAELSVARLAEQIEMSPYTFSKLFKATFQVTPHSFVLWRRLERAEALLKGRQSLSEIALSLGFASQSHFTEAFRRRTGRTPMTARRRG